MRRWKELVCIALFLTVFAGCNTVRGVGKDIERGGEAIQRGTSK